MYQRAEARHCVSPFSLEAELGCVGAGKERGESKQRVCGEEAVLACRGWIDEQIHERMSAAELGQRAVFAPAQDGKLPRFASDQRLGGGDDIDVATTGAE